MILFYLLIAVMPLPRHPLWARFFGELTIIKYLGVACLLYALAYLATRRTALRIFQTWEARWFVLLAFLAMTSFLTIGTPEPLDISPFMSYVSFVFLFFTTLAVVDSPGRLRGVLLAAIGSVAFASLYVLREWQKYPEFRPGWVAGDPNYFTVSALLCMPLAFYLMQEQRPRWEKVFCMCSLAVTLLAITLAASRGGFFGLVAGSLLAVWRSRHRVRNVVLASALLLPLSLVLPASPLERLLSPSHGDQESTQRHIALWKAGLRIIAEHPLIGVGLGNFNSVVVQYAEPHATVQGVAHNAYIEIAAELGLPGLLAFLAVLFGSFRTLEQVRRQTLRSGPPLLHQATQAIQTGLVAYAVAIFFISAQYQKLFWLMAFLSMCLPALVGVPAMSQYARTESRVPTA